MNTNLNLNMQNNCFFIRFALKCFHGAVGITPEGIFKDITTFGLLFESLVIHDLRIYADTMGAHG